MNNSSQFYELQSISTLLWWIVNSGTVIEHEVNNFDLKIEQKHELLSIWEVVDQRKGPVKAPENRARLACVLILQY